MSGIGLRGSEGLVLTGVGGIALISNALFRYTDFRASFSRTFHKNGQNGATAVLRGAIRDLRSLGVEMILVRLDSAFDAAENYAIMCCNA